MSRFNDKYSGRRTPKSFGGRGRKSDSGAVRMHSAVCDSCGKDCQVPFKPSGDKPIYCSNCFEKEGGSSERSDRRGSRSPRGNRSFNDKEMYSAVCDDCGRECQVPFRPTGDKPIYCSKCFENRGNSHDGDGRSNQNEMLEEINSKLDRILKALEN